MSLYEVVTISSDESDYDSDATLPLPSTAAQTQYSPPIDFSSDSEMEEEHFSRSPDGETFIGDPEPDNNPETQYQYSRPEEIYSSASSDLESESLLTTDALSNSDLQRLVRETRQEIDRAREEIKKIQKFIAYKKRILSFCIVNLPID